MSFAVHISNKRPTYSIISTHISNKRPTYSIISTSYKNSLIIDWCQVKKVGTLAFTPMEY